MRFLPDQTRSVPAGLLRLEHLRCVGVSLKPGDFPLRSEQSRAAARRLLAARQESPSEDDLRQDEELRIRIEEARARVKRFADEQPVRDSV